jgi:hypothetical protein
MSEPNASAKRHCIEEHIVPSQEPCTSCEDATLPPDLWALVLDHLTNKDVRACAASAIIFLHYVIPTIRVVAFTNYHELNSSRKRFENVKRVYVLSYVSTDTENIYLWVDGGVETMWWAADHYCPPYGDRATLERKLRHNFIWSYFGQFARGFAVVLSRRI